MFYDCHLHSEFSDDSEAPIEEQIASGIRKGLTGLCFTEHVDYGIKKDRSEGNITYREENGKLYPNANVDYPAYFPKLAKLKEQYAGRIKIFAGLEFGMQTHTVLHFQKLYDTYREKLDCVLLSCHEVGDLGFWTGDYMRGRTQKEYNEAYYNEIYEVMKVYKDYCVLAHLDLLARYDPAGPYPFAKCRDQIAAILEMAIREGKGIEINTSSWHYGLADTQPSRDILYLYKDLGGTIITMGSDAHVPRYVGDHFADAAAVLRDEIGFRRVYHFEKMQPIGEAL